MKNKKLICATIATALLIPGVVGLSGCNKPHVHAFNSDAFYEVVTDGQNKYARSWSVCQCGAEDAHKKITNAVIVNPQNAQDALDGKIVYRNGIYVVDDVQPGEVYENIDNKVIVFDDGNYSHLEIRPSKITSKAYNYYESTPMLLDSTTEVDINSLTSGDLGRYHYTRSLNNVTFAGTEDAVFNGLFAMRSTHMYNNRWPLNYQWGFSESEDVKIDPIRNISCDTSTSTPTSYISHISLTNVSIERLEFNGKNGRVGFMNTLSDATIENVNVKNCSFNTEVPGRFAAITFEGAGNHNLGVYDTPKEFKKITIKNNKINGHFQGVMIYNANNANIINNEIKNTSHNAIAIQTSDTNESAFITGDIKILNNKIENTGDRALRFSMLINANVLIKNNSFTNAVDSDNELLKSYSQKYDTWKDNLTENVSLVLKNNTYNGNKMEDKNLTENDFADKVFVVTIEQ